VHLGSSKTDIPTDSKMFSGLKDVKKYKDKDKYNYTSGEVSSLSEAIPIYKKARENGFTDAVVVSFSGDQINAGQEQFLKGEIIDRKVVAVKVDPSRIVYTNTIYFDFNKSEVDPMYKRSLDSVCTMLKREKNLNLVAFSISDTVGTVKYNFSLSKKRAATVKSYLAASGVDARRFRIFILGENVPLDYERRNNSVISNRRVELLLVKK
jgi:outer membrane protein OmpA-like peptidoglycan-associated protein